MMIETVLVQIMAVDARTKSVLVIYNDYMNLQKISVWVPVVSLSASEISLRPPAASFSKEYILEEFLENSMSIISLSAKQALLGFFKHDSTSPNAIEECS